MKTIIALLGIGLCTIRMSAQRSSSSVPQNLVSLPQIRDNGTVKQLFVNGEPFIMLAGELHNSSASSVQYMEPIWDRIAAVHLNTVIGTVSWELLEPEEGKFDFTLVDAQLKEARKRNLHLVLIWFGSWKNGDSKYAPFWVKTDRERFPVQRRTPVARTSGQTGPSREPHNAPLSPFGKSAMLADANAYRVLMHHIKDVDPQHTVIMMQVENEIGLLGASRDHSQLAEEEWSKAVPVQLMKYLIENRSKLLPETIELWAKNGYKTTGTWGEVFGDDPWADETFMAWQYASYVNKVIEEGRAQLNIPMYVNAWLGPQPGAVLPGEWPSGGPVARVMDVWRAGATAVDLFAPDIYVDDFKGTCALYTRSGNPLFIPEARDQAGNLFWALGTHSALGWSVFGVDDLGPDGQISKAYATLNDFLPQLAKWQAEGKVAAILLTNSDQSQVVKVGGYKITLGRRTNVAAEKNPALQAGGVSLTGRALPGDTRAFGLIINTAPDEFLMVGSNISPSFAIDSPTGSSVAIASIDEGHFESGRWIPGRRLNGDEGSAALGPMQWTSENRRLGMLKVRLYRIPD